MLATIACNFDKDILAATLPLFEAAEVEAIEWSFDTLYFHRNIPTWFGELLDAFGAEDRLIGHGVYFSIFTSKMSQDQFKWLENLSRKSKRFNFNHITEHFGFMTGEHFHNGAPVSLPLNNTTLRIGQDRLMRLSSASEKPVGLENLALAYSLDDVKIQGSFLKKVLEPVNGFIILDLHNLYCQCHNFDVDYQVLLQSYDLTLVREIHISGGSWESSNYLADKKVRRDTHDDRVPKFVFEMLEYTIPLCENLKFVVLEQIGPALKEIQNQLQFQNDFKQMKSYLKAIQKTEIKNEFKPPAFQIPAAPFEDMAFLKEQKTMTHILETATSVSNARALFKETGLNESDWQVKYWEDHMLDTAIQIAQKWK